jgi:hypothetical protein
LCALPSPGVGCSPTECNPCTPAPANARAVCNGTQCDFE